LIDLIYSEGIKWITFWWWEPFLNKRIYEIIKYTHNKWMKTCVITNWTVLNKEKLLETIPYLDELLVSIDSWISETHDEIRGKKWTFIKALEFIKFVDENRSDNFTLSIDTTIQKINCKNFYSIIDIALKYNTYLNFDPVQLYWYWNNSDSKLKPNLEDVNFIELKLRELKKNYSDTILQSDESLDRIISYFKWWDINIPCKSIDNDLILDPYWNIIECWWRNKIKYNILKEWWIQNTNSCMWDDCKKCWFSHVRVWDYDDWYSPVI
jgi:MoaA/NifB/PqqE/SkfB family radical SAM enzyme